MSTEIEKYIFENTRTSHKRWESMVMYALHFALRDVELKSQYSVGTYLLDGYFPELNLAVEIDEKYHNATKEADLIRENNIKEILNCEFFRIDVEKPVYEQVDTLIKKVRATQPKTWEIILKEKKSKSDGSYSNERLQELKDADAFKFIDDLQVELESMGFNISNEIKGTQLSGSNGMIGFLVCFDGLLLTLFCRKECKVKLIVSQYDELVRSKLDLELSEWKCPKLKNRYKNILDIQGYSNKEESIHFLQEISKKLES